MTSRITLLSHAVTPSIRRAAFPLDESLEPTELARIHALRWTAPRTQQVLCGPERRCMETAAALGLAATTTPDLRDLDYATWQGRDLENLQTADPQGLLAWLTDPTAAPHHGESIAALIDRTAHWLAAQATSDQTPTSGHTLAITHPAIVRAAIVTALDAPLAAFWRIDIAPLTLTDLRHNGHAWTIRSTAASLLHPLH